jgi:hypothetical protein
MDKDKKNLLKEKVGWCAVCYHLERIPSTRPPTSSLRTATPIDFEFKKMGGWRGTTSSPK